MLVVPKLEGLCLIGIHDDDLSLHVFMEAIDVYFRSKPPVFQFFSSGKGEEY